MNCISAHQIEEISIIQKSTLEYLKYRFLTFGITLVQHETIVQSFVRPVTGTVNEE